MPDQQIEYGTTSVPLEQGTYTKSNRSFLGWYAYWSERNQWYYESSDQSTRGWYKEGYQPMGYKKYRYSDGQKVSRTAKAGGHIYMYAAWDEFYIYYDAGGAIINANSIKVRTTGRYADNAQNSITAYTNDHLYSKVEQNISFSGYHLYRRDVDKWYYQKNDTLERIWLRENQVNTSIYKKYLKPSTSTTLNKTAFIGETLVLQAQWISS